MKVKLVCDVCGSTAASRYYVFNLYTLDTRCADIEGRPLHKDIVKTAVCSDCYHRLGKKETDPCGNGG